MDDLISRAAAIDALKKISFSHWFECGEYLSEDTREIEIISSNKALEVIEALPSAQPEPLTDDEQRIFLAAMGREEELCRWLESECNGPCEVDLVRTCHEITRKVKGALWDGN